MVQPSPPNVPGRALRVGWVVLRRSISWLVRPSRARAYRAVRRGLEDLGLTYLKFGQFLAMRFDILPPGLCRELARLFETVQAVPFDQIRAVVEGELGLPPDLAFARFERSSIAAASVAQVHVAWTWAGEKVAVKVQRPGVAPIFEADIRLLSLCAAFFDRIVPSAVFSARDTIEEFADWTRGELDFVQEGRVAERLRRDAGPGEYFPRIHWELTGRRLLTSEFIEGPTLGRVLAILDGQGGDAEAELRGLHPGLDLARFGRNLVRSVLDQLFVRGFFHGDPHPGNIIIGRDNRVSFVDFGIFGELHPRQRRILARQIQRISVGDVDGCYECVREQYLSTDATDWGSFEREVKQLLRDWYRASMDPHSPIKARHLGNHSAEIIEAARRHGLRGGINSLLYWRALYVLDASALKLGDHLDLFAEIADFFGARRAEEGALLLSVPMVPASSPRRAVSAGVSPPPRIQRSRHRGSQRPRERALRRIALLLIALGGLWRLRGGL